MTRAEASAWIDHHLRLRTIAALERLRLRAGDVVVKKVEHVDPGTGEFHEYVSPILVISSIGSHGLVYFKGGNGQCGWPSSLSHA